MLGSREWGRGRSECSYNRHETLELELRYWTPKKYYQAMPLISPHSTEYRSNFYHNNVALENFFTRNFTVIHTWIFFVHSEKWEYTISSPYLFDCSTKINQWLYTAPILNGYFYFWNFSTIHSGPRRKQKHEMQDIIPF